MHRYVHTNAIKKTERIVHPHNYSGATTVPSAYSAVLPQLSKQHKPLRQTCFCEVLCIEVL